MSDAFVLGAGFSRAISVHMPVINQLGDSIVNRMDLSSVPAPSNLPPSDFESWLTFLAEDQPWQSEESNLRNRATFLRATAVLREVLAEHERLARDTPPPDWLRQLVARWHRDRAAVISLNYDTLVEGAYLETIEVRSPSTSGNYVSHVQLAPTPLTPAGARFGAVLGPSAVETFALLKLHGSLTWYYSGRSSFFGETIYDVGVPRNWGQSRLPSHAAAGVVDKVPLIVPPTAGKSSFFNNETVRAQWQLARESLESASRVVCLGYSLPPSDLLMRFLLGESSSAGKEVEVVDLRDEAGARYRDALPACVVQQRFSGRDAIPNFVHDYDGPTWSPPIATATS